MLEEYGFLSKRGEKAEVNISPLLDMVFILLIFFVITTNFSRETGLDVNKPRAASASYQGNNIILIGISREGAVYIHGKRVSLDELVTVLKRELNARPDLKAVIVGDRHSELGMSVKAMDACLSAGVKNVSVAAED
ncbi:MAG: ExbD/TolR family protein [Chitinivibrionales bacterium]